MQDKILEAYNEMNYDKCETFEELLSKASKYEILDAYLRYEGIQGYTTRIIRVVDCIDGKAE